MIHSTRRKFIGNFAAASAASLLSTDTIANSFIRNQKETGKYLIKGAYVLSMDKQIGELKKGDIMVSEGKIQKVASNISDNSAQLIDANGMIALPGFIETHWHVWTTLLRAMSSEDKTKDYFTLSTQFGKLFSPQNTYDSTRLALAEAIYGGITHVHDWCHNVASEQHAQASLKAIAESGIRARFSAGVSAGKKDVDIALLKQLHQNWKNYATDGRIQLGLAWPGMENGRKAAAAEVEEAKSLNLPISVHVGRRKDKSDQLSQIADAGLILPGMQFIHAVDTTAQELQMIASNGGSVSVSPYSELRIGYGLPPVPTMLNCGAPLGFSVDTMPLTGNADMFGVMKIFQNLAAGMARNEFEVTANRVLEIATIEGARSMGIDKITGSLTPGKSADLQLIDTRSLNLGFPTNPYHLIVTAAQPQNVDMVMVEGKILKQGGKLAHIDIKDITTQAETSLRELISKAG